MLPSSSSLQRERLLDPLGKLKSQPSSLVVEKHVWALATLSSTVLSRKLTLFIHSGPPFLVK